MKKLLLLTLFIGFTCFCFAQTPNWLWAVGGTNSGYGYTTGLTTDNSGNLYISGRTGGSALTFGGKTISPSGTIPFVEKLDSAANGVWLSANYPFSSFSYTYALGVDDQDNSFITGNDESGSAVFIERFTASGNLAWSIIAPNANCEGAGIAADNLGNVFSTGNYSSTAISFGSTTLPSGSSSYSGYLVKQDTTGNFRWATYFSSTSGSYVAGKHVVTDRLGNVYVCGGYQGTATFYSANSSTAVTTPASVATGSFSDLFIAKYDSSGTVLWVTTAANAGLAYNSYYYSNEMAIDSCGNLYVGGIFQNTAQFGNIPVTSSGGNDVFVGKYNTLAQQWEWVQSGGSAGSDYLTAITLDKNSDVYVVGEYQTAPATFGASTLSTGNTFVAKYANSNGALQWVQSATCSGVTGIAVNKQKQVYISGGIEGSEAVFGSLTLAGVANGLFIAMLDTVPQRSIVPVVQSGYCPGSSAVIPFSITGTFNSGNVFTAQLSNDSGSFNSPVNLGTLAGTSGGMINIVIPPNTPAGANYLTRVISSSPAMGSYANECGAYYANNVYINNFPVAIGGGPLTAHINVAQITSGQVMFNADSSIGAISKYHWDFGDGDTSDVSDPVHTYIKDSTYNACLTVFGCPVSSNVVCKPVDINSAGHCSAYFKLYADSSNPHHWFALNESVGKSPITYNWTWGDGSSGTGDTASHIYAASGYYTICLTITDDMACTSTYCDSSVYLYRMDGSNTMVYVNVINSIATGLPSVKNILPNNLLVLPNPCSTCEVKGIDDVNNIFVTDILGRQIDFSFAKASGAYTINFSQNLTGMFLLHDAKTGQVIKFIKQ